MRVTKASGRLCVPNHRCEWSEIVSIPAALVILVWQLLSKNSCFEFLINYLRLPLHGLLIQGRSRFAFLIRDCQCCYCLFWSHYQQGMAMAAGGKIGSIKVSGKRPTYPSPKPTLTCASRLGQNVGLGEGWVGKKLCIGSCSVVVGIEPRDCYKPLLVLHF